jgi:hypothetical protein
VVFAAAALEGFFNELTDLVGTFASGESPEPLLVALAAILEDLEESRASLESKFIATKWILAGQAYDKGQQPYQDFKLPIALRNGLIHYRSDRFDFDPESAESRSTAAPAFMRGLEAKDLVAKFIYSPKGSDDKSAVEARASWLAKISTSAIALWACNSTADMVQSILDVLPKNRPGDVLRHIYRNEFTRIR